MISDIINLIKSKIKPNDNGEITGKILQDVLIDIVNNIPEKYIDIDIKNLLNNKIDKIEGKGLSTNDYTTEEKTKLTSLENYNDTDIKNTITDINNKLNTLLNNPDDTINSFNEISEFLNGIDKENTLLGLLNQIKALLNNKVDKIEGKGLSTNDYTTEEKTKLTGLVNYDDTELRGANERLNGVVDNLHDLVIEIDNRVDVLEDKQLNTESYTTEEKTKLASLENYDDTTLVASINNKVDKVEGKGLSTNDYTTEEKAKLTSLTNYDDTEIRTLINNADNELSKIHDRLLSTEDYSPEEKQKLASLENYNDAELRQLITDLTARVTALEA